jgi:hypothetical protein
LDIVKEERQRNEFRDLLFSLADSQKILQSSSERVEIYTLMDAVHPPRKGQALRCALGYKQLEGLYYSVNPKEAFRHYYSDIFSVLSRIQQGDQPGSIDVLGQNLMELRKRYKPVNYDSDNKLIDISDNIRKLYDHVSLDIVYGLFYYIDRVVREKKEHRLFPFIWVNVIWMVLIALTVGAWLFGLVEKRNMGI